MVHAEMLSFWLVRSVIWTEIMAWKEETTNKVKVMQVTIRTNDFLQNKITQKTPQKTRKT